MKKRNFTPILAIIYYLTAICGYVAAIFNFAGNNSSLGVVWLSIGSTMICLGTLYTNLSIKAKKEESNQNDDGNKPENIDKK